MCSSRLLPLLLMLVLLSSSSSSSADTITSQCSSLLRSFPFSTPPTWHPGTDCCRHGWDGVTCSPSTGLITSLDLADRKLFGPIGSSLFDITSLESLNLAYNDFAYNPMVPIPSSGFENLPNLTRLNLSASYFSGQIPVGISRLTKLVSLDLSYNLNLQLNNPNFEMLVQNLFSLEQLYLDYVNISESVGHLARVLTKAAPRIKVLSLSYCFLSGPIDSSLSKLSTLSVLDLSSNWNLQLNNPNFEMLVQNLFSLEQLYLDYVNISESVGHLARVLSKAAPRIKVLSLSGCSLSGPIDSSLSKLSTLSVLDLSFNELNSPVPEFLANFSSLTVLRLINSGLRGLFPTNIFHLKSLTRIGLSDNPMLSGSFPDFAQGGGLESLELWGTNFSGNFPSSIGNLKSLKTLDLSSSNFSGVIPSSIAYLPQLLRLDLSYNSFSGAIPSVMPATISELNLAGNLLTGSIFPSIRHLKSLEYLDLSDNNFSGSIPPSIRHLKSLDTLDLSYNNFSGSIPPYFGELLHLRNLVLSKNSLSGQIPASLFTHPSLSMMQFLDLSQNYLSGEVPSSVFQLSGLEYLDLAHNDFNGTIETDWFRGLEDLYEVDLSFNSLSVKVGDGNSSLPYPTLYVLGLASCNLTQVPSFLRYRNQMDYLDLSSNRIGGAIPNWIWGSGGDSRGVQSLNLSHNQFTSVEGPLPTLSKYPMFTLDLHSNLLQGPIPIPTTDIIILDYSNNNFSSIPTNISLYLTSANFFSLANNNITGEIPQSICEARHLEVLDFSNNIFSGPIPPCLLEIDNYLNVLNLRNNQLRSTLPWNISSSCGLRTLNLNGNRLEGKVPPSLTNCHSLEVLDMGNNRITDSFPHWLSSISSLRVLVLRSNKFYGPIIGSTLGNYATGHYTFPVLQILDLSSNHFNDTLPFDFFKGLKGMMVDSGPNCSILKTGYNSSSSGYYDAVTIIAKGMVYSLVRILTTFTSIDLSDNGFTGNIPELIGELRYLHMLNLSQNALTGQIPASIRKMMQLESLDLSRNRLSGEIPQELASLTFLSFLNLSDNKLVGRIPQGNQLSTFSYASYQGNEGLCGIPLPKQCGYAGPPPITGGGEHHSDDNDSTYVIGLALFTGLGYGVGIALVLVLQNVSVRRGRRDC